MKLGDNQSLADGLLLAEQTDKILDMNGMTRWISEEVVVGSGMKLCNGFITYQTANGVVKLQGSHPVLEDIVIDSRSLNDFNRLQRGIVELYATVGAVIQEVRIKGRNNRKAIFCKTKASSTKILNVHVSGGLGWGLLFNDAVSEQFPEYRGDFTGEIGQGLLVDGFTFSNLPGTDDGSSYYGGDALEINCPDHGFDDITVRNVIIENTRSNSGSNGIGLGFASCTNVIVEDVQVSNTAHDGIHYEKGGTHLTTRFHTLNCNRALVTTHTSDSHFVGGTCTKSGRWITCYNDRDFGTMTGARFEDITFDGCTHNGITISNARHVTLKDLTCLNYAGDLKSILTFYNEKDKGPVTDSLLDTIHFDQGTSELNPQYLIRMVMGSTRNTLRNITCSGKDYSLQMLLDPGNVVHP